MRLAPYVTYNMYCNGSNAEDHTGEHSKTKQKNNVVKVLWTCVMQVQRKFRSYNIHVAPLETTGIFNVEMIPYCRQM